MKRRLGIEKEHMKYEEAAKKLSLNQKYGIEFQTPKKKKSEAEFIEKEKKIDQSLTEYLDKRKEFEQEKASLRVQAEEFLQNFDEDVFDTLSKELQAEIVDAYKQERYRAVSLSPDLSPKEFSQLQLNSFLEYINIKEKISKKFQFFSEKGNKVTTGTVGSDEKKRYLIVEGKNLSQVLFPEIEVIKDDQEEVTIKKDVNKEKEVKDSEEFKDDFISIDDYEDDSKKEPEKHDEQLTIKKDDVNKETEEKEVEDEFVPIDEEDFHVELELDQEKTKQLMSLLTSDSSNKRKIEIEQNQEKTPEKKQKHEQEPKDLVDLTDEEPKKPEVQNDVKIIETQKKMDTPKKDKEVPKEEFFKTPEKLKESKETFSRISPIIPILISPEKSKKSPKEIIDLETEEFKSPQLKSTPNTQQYISEEDLFKTPEKVEINSQQSTPENDDSTTENGEGGFEEVFYYGIDDEAYLESEKSKHQKRAQTVTKSLLRDTKELLDLLGIPYIDSPYEADSQCAFLNRTGYVDAVISEDNDILLFGGTCVCRNIFSRDEKDLPEMYTMENIESNLGFTREILIQLGILLGNDYTEGVRNLGIVSATEYVAHFKSKEEDPKKNISESLDNFAKWVKDLSLPQKGTFNDKYFKQKVKLVLPKDFPSEDVMNEYLEPKFDPECPSFKWEDLNMEKLIEFSENKMGLLKQQLEKQLKPALEKRNITQTNIQSYFLSNQVGNIKSKRLQKAIETLKK